MTFEKDRKPTPAEVSIKELLEWLKKLPPEIRTQDHVTDVNVGLQILERMYYEFDGKRYIQGIDIDIATLIRDKIRERAASSTQEDSDYETVRVLDQRLSELLLKIESL
jgi:hypothetical protein